MNEKQKKVAQERADVLLEAADQVLGTDMNDDQLKDALSKSKQLKDKADKDFEKRLITRVNRLINGSPTEKEPVIPGPLPQHPDRCDDGKLEKVLEAKAKTEKWKEHHIRELKKHDDMKVEVEMAEKVADGKEEFDSMKKFYESVSKYKEILCDQAARSAVADQKKVEDNLQKSEVRIKVGTSASKEKLEAKQQKLEQKVQEDLKNSRKGELVLFTARQREDSRQKVQQQIHEEFLQVLHDKASNPAVYVQQMAESIRYMTQHLLEVLDIWPELNSCEVLVARKGKSRKEFLSVKEATGDGFKLKGINKCLNGEVKTHKGYVWEWTRKSII